MQDTAPHLCPSCGFFTDGASAADGSDKAPKAGDLMLCINCGEPAIYTTERTRRQMTAEDERDLTPRQRGLIAAARAYARQRGPVERKEHHA